MKKHVDSNRPDPFARVSPPARLLGSCLALVGVLFHTLASAAEPRPKLAVMEVEPSAVLAQKYARRNSVPAAGTPAQASARPGVSCLGEWRGKAKKTSLVLWITRAPNGSLMAKLANKIGHNTWESTSVSFAGTRLNLGFHKNTKAKGPDGGELLGEIDPSSTRIQANWTRCTPPLPIILKRVGDSAGAAAEVAAPSPSAVATPPDLSLEQMIEAMDTQLADQLEAANLFEIMGAAELGQAIPPSRGTGRLPYNLKDPATLQQFQKAGVRYLLLPTVEEFTAEVVDGNQWSLDRQTKDFNLQGSSHSTTSGAVIRGRGKAQGYRETARSGSLSGSIVKEQQYFDPKIQKWQILFLTMRSQLFDTTTGALLDSDKSSFTTNRGYVALAQGRNELLTDDLIQGMARAASEWAEVRVGAAVFPVKVVDRTEKEVTINRGSGSALRLGQVYGVYKPGKELRDPTTGESLGPDEETVGRVTLREFHEKFSKAGILEDKGIVPGAILRRITY